MKLSERIPALLAAVFVLGGGVILSLKFFGSGADMTTHVDVRVPALSDRAKTGKSAFDANCASCHGTNAAGSNQGPPLVHEIYNPGHHADGAFLMAVTRGVRKHHWPYGNMLRQPQVSRAQVIDIVRYVRELQAANGISYKPHKM